MDLISAKEAANKWGISQRRVAVLCSENRIPGASMLGNMWVIPADAEKPEDERSNRAEKAEKTASPFLKWAGGKSQLLDDIRKKYPKTIERYCEPFVGGGAVLLDILMNFSPKEVLINDINAELINTYLQIKINVDELITTLVAMQESFWPKSDDERKIMYLKQRERFNELKTSGKGSPLEMATLFIFLNRTCFNGLYRVNSKGQFNVPMGAYKKPLICDEDNLRIVNKFMQNVEIRCGDYSECADFIDGNTFVYIDPPYRPLSSTASFTSYSENEFGDKQQIELCGFIDTISAKGARVVASNSDPKNCDKADDFFDNLYSEYSISRVSAKRMINSKGNNRGNINELLICNFEDCYEKEY